MPVFETTSSSNLSNSDIASYAEQIGRHHEVYDQGRADLAALLGKLGGSLEYADGDESLHVLAPGSFTVYLPHFTSARRDRFTMAHELGHYFLHYRLADQSNSMRFGRGGRNRAETEANVFASALLMPTEEFRERWGSAEGDEWLVAQHFDVSAAAAQVRAQVLGLARVRREGRSSFSPAT